MRYFIALFFILVSRLSISQNTFPSNGNVGIGTSSPQWGLDLFGFGQRIMNTSPTGYTTLRLYNDQNSAYRALEIDYSGSAYSSSTTNGSPTGEGASIVTTGAFPLSLGTSNTARMTILSNGYIGIGTNTPTTNLHIGSYNGGGLRIGIVNDPGNTAVPARAQTAQYNLDFTGYRDNTPDQIGARIAALRFNAYIDNYAGIQNVGLAFYTNPSGTTAGAGGLVEQMRIDPYGNVGIGNNSPDAKLAVKGQVHAQEVKVDLNGAVAPDYVFSTDYKLASLEEIRTYIDQNKHLPEVPSAKEMEKNGVQLGEMNMLLLKKIEELTLYVIELKNENELQRVQNTDQQKQINELKNRIK